MSRWLLRFQRLAALAQPIMNSDSPAIMAIAGMPTGVVSGYDVGGVLTDTTSPVKHEGHDIYRSTTPGAYACVMLNCAIYGPDSVNVVSRTQKGEWFSWYHNRRIEHWVIRYLRNGLCIFNMGVPESNVVLTCDSHGPHGKGVPIKDLGITHFIDNTVECGFAAIQEGGADWWIDIDSSRIPEYPHVPLASSLMTKKVLDKRIPAGSFYDVAVRLGLAEIPLDFEKLFEEVSRRGPPITPHRYQTVDWLQKIVKTAESSRIPRSPPQPIKIVIPDHDGPPQATFVQRDMPQDEPSQSSQWESVEVRRLREELQAALDSKSTAEAAVHEATAQTAAAEASAAAAARSEAAAMMAVNLSLVETVRAMSETAAARSSQTHNKTWHDKKRLRAENHRIHLESQDDDGGTVDVASSESAAAAAFQSNAAISCQICGRNAARACIHCLCRPCCRRQDAMGCSCSASW